MNMPASSTTELILAWLRRLPTSSANEEITASTELIDRGILDSIAILELVAFLEESFSFVLPLDEFVPENFFSPNAVADMVERLTGAASERD
jgi:acyl carrier protein